MRFVDISDLEFPDDWHIRAGNALEELRQEIAVAEQTARAAGEDPVAARRSAISEGLKKPARQKIWQDMRPYLAALTKEKCWYSESLNPTSDKDLDHFRPKNRVEEDASHEGYWWLAFTWQNFRYSSQWCNQRRVDETNDTDGGKWDHFPLRPNSFRARHEADDIELEDPELLDPIDPGDWKLLTFRSDGYPTPVKQAGTIEHTRAAKSIDVYHLHCKPLVNGRQAVVGAVLRMIQDLERLHSKIDDKNIRAIYKRREIDLLRAIHPHSEYSAAALACCKAEIYKTEGGHPVKRDWLEEILSVFP